MFRLLYTWSVCGSRFWCVARYSSAMRVVVTGGAGFIGGNLCRSLVTSGFEVVAFDDLSTGRVENLDHSSTAALVRGSLLDAGAVRDVIAGADAVVHLGARPSVPKSIADPMRSHTVNVDGTMHLLEACRAMDPSPHVIFASSSSVYGANPTLPKHEALATLPRSPYAASKLAGESYVLGYQATYGIPALAFRFFNVFGPLQRPDHAYAAVVPAFVASALAGRALPVFGDGSQTRDFTFVDTVVEVITRALRERIVSPGPVNLAFGTRSSLMDVVALLSDILGCHLETEHLAPRAGDVRDSQADNTTLRALFPDLQPVALRAGLERTVEWMRTLGPVPDSPLR